MQQLFLTGRDIEQANKKVSKNWREVGRGGGGEGEGEPPPPPPAAHYFFHSLTVSFSLHASLKMPAMQEYCVPAYKTSIVLILRELIIMLFTL